MALPFRISLKRLRALLLSRRSSISAMARKALACWTPIHIQKATRPFPQQDTTRFRSRRAMRPPARRRLPIPRTPCGLSTPARRSPWTTAPRTRSPSRTMRRSNTSSSAWTIPVPTPTTRVVPTASPPPAAISRSRSISRSARRRQRMAAMSICIPSPIRRGSAPRPSSVFIPRRMQAATPMLCCRFRTGRPAPPPANCPRVRTTSSSLITRTVRM